MQKRTSMKVLEHRFDTGMRHFKAQVICANGEYIFFFSRVRIQRYLPQYLRDVFKVSQTVRFYNFLENLAPNSDGLDHKAPCLSFLVVTLETHHLSDYLEML